MEELAFEPRNEPRSVLLLGGGQLGFRKSLWWLLCIWREEAKGQVRGPGEEGVVQRRGLVASPALCLQLYVLGSGPVSSNLP